MFSLHSHVSSEIANISAHFFLCNIQQMGASHSLHLLELTKREAQFCVFCTDFLTLSSPQPYEVILFFLSSPLPPRWRHWGTEKLRNLFTGTKQVLWSLDWSWGRKLQSPSLDHRVLCCVSGIPLVFNGILIQHGVSRQKCPLIGSSLQEQQFIL